MRRVYVEDLQPGMIVARTIVATNGRPLLTQNHLLTGQYIKRLVDMGIGSIYIKDVFTDIEVPEVISKRVLTAVSNNLRNSIKNLSAKKAFDVNALKKSIVLLLEDLISNRQILFQLEDIRAYDDHLFFHSINVTIFSLMAGLSLDYTESDLMDLGLGAMLHDIGMIFIDTAVTNKADKLDAEELEQVKKHPELGFNILRAYREVSIKSAHMAYQHHERFDGYGYPRQLERKQIIEYAKIAAVADTFDAIISDRPYRKGYSTTEALIVLRGLSGRYFDPDIVEAFTANIAMYPVGSLLELNTGYIAVVTAVSKVNTYRPVINIICDQGGRLIKPAFKIDLQRTGDVHIIKRLNYGETEFIRQRIVAQQNSPPTSQ